MLPKLRKNTVKKQSSTPHNLNPNSEVYSNVPWYIFKLAVIQTKLWYPEVGKKLAT